MSIKPQIQPTQGRIGPYALLDRLGQGGMAEVFVARLERENDFKKLVAIKRMLPMLHEDRSFAKRFLDEARTVANLSHPNLVQVFDMGEDDGRPYLVMELIDGVDLWRLINFADARGRGLPMDAAVFVASEVARGLGYVHAFQFQGRRMNIVHRDVSPQNICISRMGEVKVVDFGIAKANSETFQRSMHTQGNAVLGKMRYMSPEQLDNGQLDGRTDLYALGVVLWELLTARRLIDAKGPADVVRQVREAKHAAPSTHNPNVTPELDAIVLKALAHDPAARYQDGATMSRALQIALSGLTPGYSASNLGEIIESRLAMVRPPTETSTEAQEVSIGAILDAEIVQTPQPGAPRPEDPILEFGVTPRPKPEVTASNEFDGALASRLEPRVLISLEPEQAPEPIERRTPEQHMVADLLEQHLAAESSVYVEQRIDIEPSRSKTPVVPVIRSYRRTVLSATAAVCMAAMSVAMVYKRSPSSTPVTAMVAPVAAPRIEMAAVPVAHPAPIVAAPVVAALAAPVIAASEARRSTSPRPLERPRLLDGKVVVGPAQDAPAGEEDAVAHARKSYEKARAALSSGHASVAAAGFERALSEYPGLVSAYYGLSSAYLADGQNDLAITALDTAVRYAGPTERGSLRLALAQLRRGEAAELPSLPQP